MNPAKLRSIGFALLWPWLAGAQVPGQNWETLTDAEAEAAGWSREKLAGAREYAATLDTEAVMIVTRGKVLDSWGAVDRKLNVHSIRKSFLSAMCGIQVEAGKLRLNATMGELGIDDNEPRLTEVEKRATVHDLLKARSGVYHPALYETERMKARRPERHSHEPGTFWYYNNWDFNTLGAIYEQETATGIYEDIKRLIGGPLRMQDYQVADGEYVTGADSMHRAYPFRMTARDMARFGLLFLRGGQWNGKQVVPAGWVKESVTSYSNAGTSGGYGYLWWITRSGMHLPGVTLPEGSYSARGSGGHYILNIPALDLVIVHRVDTDIDGRKVESAEFGELVRRILLAYQPRAADTAPDTLVPLLEMMKADRSGAHSISGSSLKMMLTPVSPPTGLKMLARRGSKGQGDIRYGLGWAIEPAASGPRIRHSGSNGTGFRSHVEFDQVKGHGLVIMTNGDGGAEFWEELAGLIGIP